MGKDNKMYSDEFYNEYKEDPFKVLNVFPNDPQSHVDSVYKQYALIYHPDKGGDKNLFNKIKNAYNAIKEYNEIEEHLSNKLPTYKSIDEYINDVINIEKDLTGFVFEKIKDEKITEFESQSYKPIEIDPDIHKNIDDDYFENNQIVKYDGYIRELNEDNDKYSHILYTKVKAGFNIFTKINYVQDLDEEPIFKVEKKSNVDENIKMDDYLSQREVERIRQIKRIKQMKEKLEL